MVLGHHREALVGRIEAGSLGHGPALEHALHLETEVVVEARGGVLLDAERPSLALSLLALRLRRDREVTLPVVFAESHRRLLSRC
jgi:hypothetical protein